MTDKVQKIREEVEKLKSQLLRGACSSQIAMETMCKEEAYNEVLAILDTMQEESVSEDLGEYINELSKQFPEVSFAKLSRIAVRVAKWQAEQFERNRLAACDRQAEEEAEIERDFVMGIIENEHRQPTFDDAIKYGMRLQKEQMMAKAIDGEIGYWNIRGLSVNVDLPRTLKEDDRVKLIIIKED